MDNDQKTIARWHVFADGYDAYPTTHNEAVRVYNSLNREQYPNARLYLITDNPDGSSVETFLRGRGSYPT